MLEQVGLMNRGKLRLRKGLLFILRLRYIIKLVLFQCYGYDTAYP